ncbi:hybrid sensor histidine kinase/response regulator [Desulfonatronum lacustre]|uniref:hybrid sensor histidine kinase/response regulator n=1 Tax=Desulfonatronum lacustre TaxID=66849 RepID=UPI0004B51AB8|nr:ATP-binding protein [Desulfonatronum lacustre]
MSETLNKTIPPEVLLSEGDAGVGPQGTTTNRDALRRRIIGLGEGSIHKSYYPQLQQRLRELHRFKTLLDGSNEGIFLIRLPNSLQTDSRETDSGVPDGDMPDVDMVDVNESACAQLGYSCQEILELSFFDLFPTKDHRRLESFLSTMDQSEHGRSIITEFIRSNGECFPVEVSSRLVRFDLDPYAVVVARDITERLRMEEELQRAGNLEALGVLAGGIAHDFNNFLTAIMNQISLAKLHLDQADHVLEKLTYAENACLQAKGLTQQLLTFAKGGEPVRKITSMASLVGDALRLVLAGTNVKPMLTIPDDLWLVDIDSGQISQVLNNLLINAVQAMPEGGMLRVTVRNVIHAKGGGESTFGEHLPHGDHLCVTIQDSGPGIPEETLAKIFDPYFTTKPQGSGLGLATSYSIIRKHGGTLTVRSKQGQGATFMFCLPATRFETDSAHSQPSEPFHSAEVAHHILFMDDDDMIRESMGEILEDIGYTVTLVRDGREALEALHQAREDNQVFDVAIMDLTIPGGMGGAEAVGRLKAVDPLLKAVVSSGYSTAPAMAHYREYGFDAVVAKPYTVNELRSVLARLLSGDEEEG